jgi:hypothetical protein
MRKITNNQEATRMSNNNYASSPFSGEQIFCSKQNKVKTLFHTQAEAESCAGRENPKRPSDRQLVPYYCKSCGGWHLGVARHRNDSGLLGTSSVLSTRATESTQWRQYRCGNRPTGHGYAAEDANALADRLRGHRVEKTGWNNESDGPDRIVDGVKVQTKYCQSARASVNSAFDKQTGKYRYPDQQLEVPKDQYDEAVKLMEEKIRDGKVDGVTDPARAKDLVRKGYYTYDQAAKITKAGNLESIKFDIRNQAGASATAGAISGVITYASARHDGATAGQALKMSGAQAGKTACKTMVTGVATQQFLRTGAGRTTTAAVQKTANKAIDAAMRSNVGFTFIEKYLKESGLEVMRDKDIFYTCLAQNRDCIIGMKNGKLKIAVALSINEEDTDIVSILANITMAKTEMVKIYLEPEGDKTNLWFSIEAFCNTEEEFKDMFPSVFKSLVDTVRRYRKYRKMFVRELKTEAMTAMMMKHKYQSHPC